MSKKRVEANGGRIRDRVAGEIPRSDNRGRGVNLETPTEGESR